MLFCLDCLLMPQCRIDPQLAMHYCFSSLRKMYATKQRTHYKNNAYVRYKRIHYKTTSPLRLLKRCLCTCSQFIVHGQSKKIVCTYFLHNTLFTVTKIQNYVCTIVSTWTLWYFGHKCQMVTMVTRTFSHARLLLDLWIY